MKKLIILALGLWLLTSCTWPTWDNSSANTVSYDKNTYFKMSIPKTWQILTEKDYPKPKNGTVELALTSNEIDSGFANNMVIISDKLNEKITSKKYSVVNYTLSTGEYVDYNKLSEKAIKFKDNDESNFYVFEAKYNTSTAKRKFFQTAKVCGDKAFLITIWVGIKVDASKYSKYEDLIKSFECIKK